MPTAARLVAAVTLAALAAFVSLQIIPLLTEGMDVGWFHHINIALGLAIGWQVIGSRCGRGYSAALGNGLTGGVVLLFWAMLIHASAQMFEKAMRLRYDGAFEAFAAIFQIMIDHGALIATPSIIMSFLVGSVLSGLLAELTQTVTS